MEKSKECKPMLFYLDERHKVILKEAAKDRGLTLSAYLRVCALDKAKQDRPDLFIKEN